MSDDDVRRLTKRKGLYEQLISAMKPKNEQLLPSGEKVLFESSIDFIEDAEYARLTMELATEFIPIDRFYSNVTPNRGLAEIASYLAERDPEITSYVEKIGGLATEGVIAHMRKSLNR